MNERNENIVGISRKRRDPFRVTCTHHHVNTVHEEKK